MEGARAAGDVIAIADSDAHKIVSVLRMRDGDAIVVIDSTAAAFDAVVRSDGKTVLAELVEKRQAREPETVRVTLAQAIPKAQKMDFVVEKCTELGASTIVPLLTERTIADASANKRERWERLARTAAMQCGRDTVAEIGEPISLSQLARTFGEYDRVLLPWELAPHEPVRARFDALLQGVRSLLVVIGPEGGFSHAEADLARQSGAEMVWLGPRILRTETAGMVVLAFINLLTGG